MSKKTHEKELARARAKREAERASQQRTKRTVGAGIVGIVAIIAIVLGFALQGGDGEPVASQTDPFATDGPTDVATDVPSDGVTDPATAEPTAAPTSAVAPCENPGEGAPEVDTTKQYDAPPPADDVADTYLVTLQTTCGDIVLQLDGAAASQTVASFVFLARDGFYDGVPFHRVQDQFVIQGGDPTGTGTGGPGYQFEDELTLAEQVVADNGGEYPRGTLAMANAGPNTNGSQFFIVQADPGYPFPPNYAVFGRVLEGMDVVDQIAQGPVEGDRAIDPVRIIAVTVEEA